MKFKNLWDKRTKYPKKMFKDKRESISKKSNYNNDDNYTKRSSNNLNSEAKLINLKKNSYRKKN